MMYGSLKGPGAETVGVGGKGLIYVKSHRELGSGVKGSNEFVMKGPTTGQIG